MLISNNSKVYFSRAANAAMVWLHSGACTTYVEELCPERYQQLQNNVENKMTKLENLSSAIDILAMSEINRRLSASIDWLTDRPSLSNVTQSTKGGYNIQSTKLTRTTTKRLSLRREWIYTTNVLASRNGNDPCERRRLQGLYTHNGEPMNDS